MLNTAVHGNTFAATQFEYLTQGGVHGNFSGRNSSFTCRVAGGSRRDQAKLVARTQHRRARHMKGLKPSKPWILKKLEEEDTEDEVQQLDGTDIGNGSFADTEKILNQWDSSVPHHGSIPHQGSIPSGRPENNLSVDGSGILATTEGNGASDEVKELSTGSEEGGKQYLKMGMGEKCL